MPITHIRDDFSPIVEFDGELFSRNQVWDDDAWEWVAMTQPVIAGGEITLSGQVEISNFPTTQTVAVDPMQDIDMTATYNDSKLNTMVITGFGKTKTMTFGWTGDNLTSISTVIT